MAADGRALGGVEPTVRAPAQAVHDRVGVFEPEALRWTSGSPSGTSLLSRSG